MSRPGFVLEVDDRTPPLIVHEGLGFRLEDKFPLGTRVVYPPESLPAVPDVDEAIRESLLHPVDMEPLPELLFAGMRLTIAFDDLSLPLPTMKSPDIRGRIIEHVLTMAAEAGVDDVKLIAANALHRRMTASELKHIVGERVFRSFYPQGDLYNFDAEDRDELAHLGVTDKGEDVEISKRAAESDLLIYVNVNLVAMDGGHKSVGIGLASYKSIKHHHNAKTMVHSRSFMDHKHSEMHSSAWRMGRLIKEHVKVFQIETTLNNDVFPKPYDFLQKREWEWSVKDQATMLGMRRGLSIAPPKMKHKLFHDLRSVYGLTGVTAGEVEAVHEITVAKVHQQHRVEVQGTSDVVVMGVPYLGPYNVNSSMNPILAACASLGYYFNSYLGQPVVRKGGAAILYHPLERGLQPAAPPVVRRLLRGGPRRVDRPARGRGEVRAAVRQRPLVHPPVPDLARLPRRPPVLHVVLDRARPRPPGRGDLGRRQPQGGRPDGLPGRDHAAGRARDGVRHRRYVAVDHLPAQPAAPLGGRALMSLIKGGVSDVKQVARGWRWGRRGQVPKSAEPFVLPSKSTVFRSDWSRRKPAMVAREVAQKAGLEPLFRSQVRTDVQGLDVLERVEGPVIFVANHASHLDTPLVLLSLPGRVAAQDRRRRGRRLLLRHLVARGRLVDRLQHLPDRPSRRLDGDHARRGARRRLVARDLPGGHPLEGRLDRPVPDGCGVPRRRARRPGRPGRAPRHVRGDAARPELAEQGTAPADRPLRRAALPRPRRGRARLRAADQGRRRCPARRGQVDLVGGQAARGAGSTPDPTGPKVAQWRRVWEQSDSPVSTEGPASRLRAWRR